VAEIEKRLGKMAKLPRIVKFPVSMVVPDIKLEVSVSAKRARAKIVEDWKGLPKLARELTRSVAGRLAGELGGKVEEKDDELTGVIEGRPAKVLSGAIVELFAQFLSFDPPLDVRERLLSMLHDIDRANPPAPPRAVGRISAKR